MPDKVVGSRRRGGVEVGRAEETVDKVGVAAAAGRVGAADKEAAGIGIEIAVCKLRTRKLDG